MKWYVILLLVILTFASDTRKLIYSIIIASNGVGNPTTSTNEWGVNYQELTAVGIRQLYLLGRQMHKRYVIDLKLIKEKFNQELVKFKSMYSIKAVPTSAYAFAAGLYYPGTGNILNDYQQKHAVPPVNFTDYKKYQEELKGAALLHSYTSVPIVIDNKVPNRHFEAISLCSSIPHLLYEYLANNDSAREDIERREVIYKEKLYPAIMKALKLTENIQNITEALQHRQHIIAAKYSSIKLSYDLTEGEYELLDDLYDIGMYKRLMGNIKISQLELYGMAKDLLKVINIIDANSLKDKMTVYVMDDLKILALLRLFNYTPERNKTLTIPYASSLILDIYKDGDKYLVEPLINGEYVYTTNKIIPLEGLKLILNETENIKFNELCDYKPDEITSSSLFFIVITFSVTGCFIIGLIIAFYIQRMRNKKSSEDDSIVNLIDTH